MLEFGIDMVSYSWSPHGSDPDHPRCPVVRREPRSSLCQAPRGGKDPFGALQDRRVGGVDLQDSGSDGLDGLRLARWATPRLN